MPCERECGNSTALSWGRCREPPTCELLAHWPLLGSDGSERDVLLRVLAPGTAWDPRASSSRVGFFLISRALTLLLLLAVTHCSSLIEAAKAVSSSVPSHKRSSARRDPNGVFWGAGGSGRAGEVPQRPFLGVGRHRGRDLSALQGCGRSPPNFKPDHEGRVLVLGHQWQWTCCPDTGM